MTVSVGVGFVLIHQALVMQTILDPIMKSNYESNYEIMSFGAQRAFMQLFFTLEP